MLSDADLATLRHDFANDRFDLTPDAHRQLRSRRIGVADLVRAVCDRHSAVRDVDYPPDPRRGEFGVIYCPAAEPPLLVSLWYIREPPRSVLVDGIA